MEQQDNGMQQMKLELLDMVQGAQDPFDIVYRMAKRLEAASGEPGYGDYVLGQMRAVYGFALQEKKLLTDELREVEKRLARMEKSKENPEFTEEERTRIGFAIDHHRKDIDRLKGLIQQAEANHAPLYLVKNNDGAASR